MTKKFMELMKDTRKRHGLSIEELSEEVKLSISFLSKMERAIVRPSPKHVVVLAKALELDPTMVLMIWLRDRLPEKQADYVPLLNFPDYRESLFGLLWEFQASLADVGMQRITEEIDVDIEGNACLHRTMEGIVPRKDANPLAQYSFRTFVAPQIDSEFSEKSKVDILEEPEGLEYEHSTIQQSKYIVHILSFPKGWSWKEQSRNAFSLKSRTYMKNAYYMDMETAQKEYRESNIDCTPMNHYTFQVINPVEELDIRVNLPEGYMPTDVEGCAWRGQRMLWEVENILDKDVCAMKEVTHKQNQLRLFVRKPLMDLSFALAWQPIRRRRYVALLKVAEK
ncbi:helix-turn-helix domain-containing protein [Acidobacteriota bacterium]